MITEILATILAKYGEIGVKLLFSDARLQKNTFQNE